MLLWVRRSSGKARFLRCLRKLDCPMKFETQSAGVQMKNLLCFAASSSFHILVVPRLVDQERSHHTLADSVDHSPQKRGQALEIIGGLKTDAADRNPVPAKIAFPVCQAHLNLPICS